VLARRFWSQWKQFLIIVTPETVVRLAPCRLSHVLEHDLEGEKAAWQKYGLEGGLDLSRGGGEPHLGAPRIHGELLMLGFNVSERTISRWMKREHPEIQSRRSAG
jgi:putative transposase